MKVYIGRYPKDDDHERKVNIRIDKWDVWNMDSTLALIVTPMLKKFRETKSGAPLVDNDDVPEELRSTSPIAHDFGPSIDGSLDDADPNYFKRWDYVLDEMIFAFESKTQYWEDKFWSEDPEIDFEASQATKSESGFTELIWKSHGKVDMDGLKAYQNRISNGFRLFGKYYEALWD